MNISELRKGNYVQDSKGNTIRVSSILENGINLEIDTFGHCPQNFHTNEKDVFPIHVTDEWLKRMNFSNQIEIPDVFQKDETNPLAPFLEEQEPIDPDDIECLEWFHNNEETLFSIGIIPDELGLKHKYTISFYESIVDAEGNLAKQGTHTIERDELWVHEVQNFYQVFFKQELIP